MKIYIISEYASKKWSQMQTWSNYKWRSHLSSYSTLAHDSNETKAEKKGNKFNIEGKKISNNLVINVITFIDKIISTVVNHIIKLLYVKVNKNVVLIYLHVTPDDICHLSQTHTNACEEKILVAYQIFENVLKCKKNQMCAFVRCFKRPQCFFRLRAACCHFTETFSNTLTRVFSS